MQLSDIHELYYITDITNVASIRSKGILSHNEAHKVYHHSIAEQGVQNRRQKKKIPGTNKNLHDYVNLYFDAHNPMLSKVRKKNDLICVLRINKDVLSWKGIIVTDQNASRNYCWFKTVNEGLPLLKYSEVFAEFLINRDDSMEEKRLKGIKCAEVLVPTSVPPSDIIGAYVANDTALISFKKVSILPVQINNKMFF